MVNMSYCRFNNTNLALDECLEALNDCEQLEGAELNACKNLFSNFINFCIDAGIVEDEDEELNDRLQEFFESISA